MQVERVDFVSFLTQDIARAKQFYTDVLGLDIETEGESDMELRCGQVTLDVFDPSSIGQPFAPSPAGLALLRLADALRRYHPARVAGVNAGRFDVFNDSANDAPIFTANKVDVDFKCACNSFRRGTWIVYW